MHTDHEKTNAILKRFEDINQIPRRSKEEERLRNWFIDWGTKLGCEYAIDDVGNLLLKVPGTAGYETSPTVVIQGHMDMVCERGKGSTHDFSKDPIKCIYDGDWVHADDTTLGADNGIALAMCMVAVESKDVSHPPLELLFTVDEETGLTGAAGLKPGFLSGELLLNIDSEDEGVFTVGCAGGRDTKQRLPVQRESHSDGTELRTLVIEGLRGGHSGVDIHKKRGNAISLLSRALDSLLPSTGLRVVTLKGGTAHNAIPRDAEALLAIPGDSLAVFEKGVRTLHGHFSAELRAVDAGVTLKVEPATSVALDSQNLKPLSDYCTRQAVDLLMAMPHGIAHMSTDIEGLVETSNNLAMVETTPEYLAILTSQRSSIMPRLDHITNRIEAVGRLAGCTAESGVGYPAWQPNMDSPLLERCKTLYEKLNGKAPVIEIIHAGLECGIIGDRYPHMDMISFGPTIVDPHSPNERLEIPTVTKVWQFLEALLAELK